MSECLVGTFKHTLFLRYLIYITQDLLYVSSVRKKISICFPSSGTFSFFIGKMFVGVIMKHCYSCSSITTCTRSERITSPHPMIFLHHHPRASMTSFLLFFLLTHLARVPRRLVNTYLLLLPPSTVR